MTWCKMSDVVNSSLKIESSKFRQRNRYLKFVVPRGLVGVSQVNKLKLRVVRGPWSRQ